MRIRRVIEGLAGDEGWFDRRRLSIRGRETLVVDVGKESG